MIRFVVLFQDISSTLNVTSVPLVCLALQSKMLLLGRRHQVSTQPQHSVTFQMLLSLSNSAVVAMLALNELTGPLSSWAPAVAGHKSTKKQASKPVMSSERWSGLNFMCILLGWRQENPLAGGKIQGQ